MTAYALLLLFGFWLGGAVGWHAADFQQSRFLPLGLRVWRALFWPRFLRWRGRGQ